MRMSKMVVKTLYVMDKSLPNLNERGVRIKYT